jgi:hypothetical protein
MGWHVVFFLCILFLAGLWSFVLCHDAPHYRYMLLDRRHVYIRGVDMMLM